MINLNKFNLVSCRYFFFLLLFFRTKSSEDCVMIEESINAVGLKIQRFDSDTMTPSACRSALALSYSLPLWQRYTLGKSTEGFVLETKDNCRAVENSFQLTDVCQYNCAFSRSLPTLLEIVFPPTVFELSYLYVIMFFYWEVLVKKHKCKSVPELVVFGIHEIYYFSLFSFPSSGSHSPSIELISTEHHCRAQVTTAYPSCVSHCTDTLGL